MCAELPRESCYPRESRIWLATGISAAPMPRCLLNDWTIGKFWTQISWLRDFSRSCSTASVRLVNRGPGRFLLTPIIDSCGFCTHENHDDYLVCWGSVRTTHLMHPDQCNIVLHWNSRLALNFRQREIINININCINADVNVTCCIICMSYL